MLQCIALWKQKHAELKIKSRTIEHWARWERKLYRTSNDTRCIRHCITATESESEKGKCHRKVYKKMLALSFLSHSGVNSNAVLTAVTSKEMFHDEEELWTEIRKDRSSRVYPPPVIGSGRVYPASHLEETKTAKQKKKKVRMAGRFVMLVSSIAAVVTRPAVAF